MLRSAILIYISTAWFVMIMIVLLLYRSSYCLIILLFDLRKGGSCHSVERSSVLPGHSDDGQRPDALARLLEHGCAIIGADVCKPGRNRLPSLVGVVGSVDGKMSSWKTALRAQVEKTEIILDFGNILREILGEVVSQ